MLGKIKKNYVTCVPQILNAFTLKILNHEQLLLCGFVATYNCKSTSVFTSWITDSIDHWSTPSSSNMMCVHIHWIEWCCKSTQDLVTLISKPRGIWIFAFCFPSEKMMVSCDGFHFSLWSVWCSNSIGQNKMSMVQRKWTNHDKSLRLRSLHNKDIVHSSPSLTCNHLYLWGIWSTERRCKA